MKQEQSEWRMRQLPAAMPRLHYQLVAVVVVVAVLPTVLLSSSPTASASSPLIDYADLMSLMRKTRRRRVRWRWRWRWMLPLQRMPV